MPSTKSMRTVAQLKNAGPKTPPDFPLWWHSHNGCFAKKINYRMRYFSSDWREALREYEELLDRIKNGTDGKPQRLTDGIKLGELCDRFYDAKEQQFAEGVIKSKTHLQSLHDCCSTLVRWLGKHSVVEQLEPEQFRRLRQNAAKGTKSPWGPVKLNNEIKRWRSVFNWALKNRLIDRLPNFGTALDAVPQRQIREAKQMRGRAMLERIEILELIHEADTTTRAMILLAINGGLGPADLSHLRQDQVDLQSGWLEQPREKTAVMRRIPLWPETIQAIEWVLKHRPKPNPNAAELLFLQRDGESFIEANGSAVPISKRFSKVAERCQLKLRSGIGIYGCRRAFQTIAEQGRDFPAVRAIMGHADESSDMSAKYRQFVDDERLLEAVNHVRTWLFGEAGK